MSRKPMSNVVTKRQIMERLGVSMMTIDNWIKGSPMRVGMTVSYKPQVEGGKRQYVIIQESDLLRWLSAYRPDLLDRWKLIPTKMRA